MGTEAMFINIVIKNKLLSSKGFSFDREAKLGGLPPAHSSESLKTNSFKSNQPVLYQTRLLATEFLILRMTINPTQATF
jgi:hypothetical protein